MKHLYLAVIFLFSLSINAQDNLDLSYYLPQDITYNPEISTPQEVLGYVPGEWHVTHDLLVSYMKTLAEESPRITLENRGATFEGRPLLLLVITSEKNHENIEEIRQNHVNLTEAKSENINTSEMPIVVYQGFSIHGNEPSGSNAALLAAYYLAAGQGEKIDEILNNTVILFDPSLNPDGLQRFAYWANTNKSENLNPDPQDREFSEVWPGGRTNHYWFDMNRDWLPVQLPESRARIATFHKWQPNILTDHHEMGSNSSFFFQPGIPSRTHPLTPQMNQDLTREIGTYHAKALDKIGSFYYTQEDFDDFYYGKGSTFPDINGSIGILFEQGSSRGHVQETDNGLLTFPFTIRNQFTAALSTLEAAGSMRSKILDYQRSFYKNSRDTMGKDAYVFGSEKDKNKAYNLAEILKRQKVEVYEIKEDFELDGVSFKKGPGYMVPKNQRQHRVVKAMFEKRTSFTDSLFYDISAWSFPLAFDLKFNNSVPLKYVGEKIDSLQKPAINTINKSDYAYLMEWQDYNAPKALNLILEKGLRAQVAMKTFEADSKKYDYGTILIPVQNQKMNSTDIFNFLTEVSENSNVSIGGVTTGLTKGINLGSNYFRPLEQQKVAIIVGNGITPYDAGEIWHLFDQRYDMHITKLDTRNFSRTDLSKYTDVILPNSWGTALEKKHVEKIKDWVKGGGTLIGYKNAARWFNTNEFMKLEFLKNQVKAKDVSFEERNDFRGAQGIGGAIFEATQDRSHPVNFGYVDNTIALFRDTTIFIKADSTSYNNPIQYTKDPLLSGYISKPNLELIANTVPFKHVGMGRGHVILFTDNT
ncbi:MAG TPA: M14 family zinc carboxypeptidase, partial [Gillisia sp.]|nr:M14 family zinc carboxypeptidase [Gillisia sp.]